MVEYAHIHAMHFWYQQHYLEGSLIMAMVHVTPYLLSTRGS